jgi:hypothetical protein
LTSVFPVHHHSDTPFVHELAAFLESGCDALCFTEDGVLRAGEDLVSRAETGLSADLLLLVLSAASNPARWIREKWEPILFGEAAEVGACVAVVLLEECEFPAVFRRKLKVFDATINRLAALRRLKRLIYGARRGTPPSQALSPELEHLYRGLADRPGTMSEAGSLASRFALEAAYEFEAVFWIPAAGRTLAEIAGDLGARLEMTLQGTLEENCRSIREVLSCARCLVIFDAPGVNVHAVLPSDRTSVLFTTEPVEAPETRRTSAAARSLVAARRYAEAYEIFRGLLDSGIEVESCARELVWICEHWGRPDEANALRFHIKSGPEEQLRLF